jgi:hypothetical protein
MPKGEKPPLRFNPKRRIAKLTAEQASGMAERASAVQYGGNPKHKMNPGDFGLSPSATHDGGDPERGADALCDIVAIFRRSEARALLQAAFRKGFVDDRFEGAWPKTVWCVTEDGHVLEAELENRHLGTYHGYPLPRADPMRDKVLNAMKDRDNG